MHLTPFLRLLPCAALAAMLFTGCATPKRPASNLSMADMASLDGPIVFSDDVSRDLARQTQRLLVLKKLDYQVGPDDVLEISIFEWEMSSESKTLEFRVSETGVISLPALGAIRVSGKTIPQIQQTIEAELETQNVLQNPRVGVAVKEYRSRRIAVVGEVNAPGVYAIHENVSTLLDMLTLAGGPTREAGQIAHVLRSPGPGETDPVRMNIDLEELMNGGNFDLNAVLRGDDTIFVPKAPLIYIYGEVSSPGGYALSRSLRVLEALAIAGGMKKEAAPTKSFLVRRSGSQGEQSIPLDFTKIEMGKAANIYLREGDLVHVQRSAAKVFGREAWDFFRGIFTFTYRLDDG